MLGTYIAQQPYSEFKMLQQKLYGIGFAKSIVISHSFSTDLSSLSNSINITSEQSKTSNPWLFPTYDSSHINCSNDIVKWILPSYTKELRFKFWFTYKLGQDPSTSRTLYYFLICEIHSDCNTASSDDDVEDNWEWRKYAYKTTYSIHT